MRHDLSVCSLNFRSSFYNTTMRPQLVQYLCLSGLNLCGMYTSSEHFHMLALQTKLVFVLILILSFISVRENITETDGFNQR